MTWLFTQVWLWSLGAFLLGSAVTWLLFVRPANRRILDLKARVESIRDEVYDEVEFEERRRELADERVNTPNTMWDVLDADADSDGSMEPPEQFRNDEPYDTPDQRGAEHPRRGQGRGGVDFAPDFPREAGPEWDADYDAPAVRPFASAANGYAASDEVTRSPEASVFPSASASEEGPPTRRTPAPAGPTGVSTPTPGANSAPTEQAQPVPPPADVEHTHTVAAVDESGAPRQTADSSAAAETRQRPAAGSGQRETRPVDDTDIRLQRQRESADAAAEQQPPGDPTIRHTPTPTAPPEVRSGGEPTRPANNNVWFDQTATVRETDADADAAGEEPNTVTGPEWSPEGAPKPGAADKPAAVEETANLTGKLRSLFEPLGTRGIEPDQREAELPKPENSPTGADEPHGSGESAGSAGSEREDARQDLPRRVPGNTARPGTPPSGNPDMSGNVAASKSPIRPGAAEVTEVIAAATDEALRESSREETGNNPQEWYPDEEFPNQDQPGENYTVKGHFASRQYHTSDSPYFDRVVAEVWFRSAEEAEEAGFEPWDGRRRT